MASEQHNHLKFPELIADFDDEPADRPAHHGDRVRYELSPHARRLVGMRGSVFEPVNRVLGLVHANADGEALLPALTKEHADAELILAQLVERGLVTRLLIPAVEAVPAHKTVRPPVTSVYQHSLVVASIEEGQQAKAFDQTNARPAGTRETILSASATRLLASLPSKVKLTATVEQYPHVLNRIADLWTRPHDLERAFNDLLMDDRVDRQGFPFDVVLELTGLRDFHTRFLRPKRDSAWNSDASIWRR